jgi:hypothetical protein
MVRMRWIVGYIKTIRTRMRSRIGVRCDDMGMLGGFLHDRVRLIVSGSTMRIILIVLSMIVITAILSGDISREADTSIPVHLS